MKQNKSICPAAFHEIYADNGGRYRLCCHALPMKSMSHFTEQKTLPFEYFLSKEIEEVRQKMYEGEQIPECKTCYQIESASGTSYREKQFEKHGTDDVIRNVTLKIRMFGNYCNLSCYMCHPYNSTTRQKELNEVFPKSNEESYNRFIKTELEQISSKNVKYSDWNKYLDHVIENIHYISNLQMMGGETLQLPKYWEFLDRIPEEYAKNIHVSQETNLTELRYKNKSILDYATKFRGFYLGVSVDHYGEKLSFMRYPIDVNKFESNLSEIQDYKNIKHRLNCTVSMLNINDLLDIKKYYEDNFKLKSPVNFNNIVRGPKYLSIRNLPDRLKKKYIEKYKDFPYVIAELSQEPMRSLDDFMTYCDKLSLHRNLYWRPLWQDFIDELHQ
ncbi:MAG: twitch domain-containing radical SAM protein [Amylibacter sp.]